MPYIIEKIGTDMYQVLNSQTRGIHAFHTTLQKALAQVRLLHSLENKKLN